MFSYTLSLKSQVSAVRTEDGDFVSNVTSRRDRCRGKKKTKGLKPRTSRVSVPRPTVGGEESLGRPSSGTRRRSDPPRIAPNHPRGRSRGRRRGRTSRLFDSLCVPFTRTGVKTEGWGDDDELQGS